VKFVAWHVLLVGRLWARFAFKFVFEANDTGSRVLRLRPIRHFWQILLVALFSSFLQLILNLV
jgi:hypothetical protein